MCVCVCARALCSGCPVTSPIAGVNINESEMGFAAYKGRREEEEAVREKRWNCCCLGTFSSLLPQCPIGGAVRTSSAPLLESAQHRCVFFFPLLPVFALLPLFPPHCPTIASAVVLPSLRCGPIVVGCDSNLRLNQTPPP